MKKPTTDDVLKMRHFARKISLLADEAMRLGLVRTSHAIRQGEQSPLNVCGYEIAELSEGKENLAAAFHTIRLRNEKIQSLETQLRTIRQASGEQPQETAFQALQNIIGIATDVFGGPVLVKESFDPEYPEEKYVVFIAEVAGDNATILGLESEWARRIAPFAHVWENFRLIVKRKK